MQSVKDLAGEIALLRLKADGLVEQIEEQTTKSRGFAREYKRLRRAAREQMIGARAHQLSALDVARQLGRLRSELLRLTKQVDHFEAEPPTEIAQALRAVAGLIDAYAG